jgi:hypothetical protein
MAKRDVFLSLFMSLESKDEACQNTILNFFKQELVVNQDSKDSGERLSLLSDSSSGQKNNTLGNLISLVKKKVNEISNEYKQELQAERYSDTTFMR